VRICEIEHGLQSIYQSLLHLDLEDVVLVAGRRVAARRYLHSSAPGPSQKLAPKRYLLPLNGAGVSTIPPFLRRLSAIAGLTCGEPRERQAWTVDYGGFRDASAPANPTRTEMVGIDKLKSRLEQHLGSIVDSILPPYSLPQNPDGLASRKLRPYAAQD